MPLVEGCENEITRLKNNKSLIAQKKEDSRIFTDWTEKMPKEFQAVEVSVLNSHTLRIVDNMIKSLLCKYSHNSRFYLKVFALIWAHVPCFVFEMKSRTPYKTGELGLTLRNCSWGKKTILRFCLLCIKVLIFQWVILTIKWHEKRNLAKCCYVKIFGFQMNFKKAPWEKVELGLILFTKHFSALDEIESKLSL